MVNLFPKWGTSQNQNNLLLIMIGVAFIAFIQLAALKKAGLSFPLIATVGAIATLACQLVLSLVDMQKDIEYLLVWHAGKLFGFLSTLSSGLMIAAVAPTERVGFWNGINAGLTNGCVGVSQLIFSRVYDSNNNGSQEGLRGQNMLLTTSSISALACIAYGILIPIWPKEKKTDKASKAKEEDYKNFDKYDALTDKEWANLPLETADKVMEQMIMAGKAPRLVAWGSYAEQRAELGGLQERALKDFEYMGGTIRTILSDRKKIVEMQEMMKQYGDMMPKVERGKAKDEMGSWIADYFDDAGYQDWEKASVMYKSMLMSAFPPIDPLDEKKPDYTTMSIEEIEEARSRWMRGIHALQQHTAGPPSPLS